MKTRTHYRENGKFGVWFFILCEAARKKKKFNPTTLGKKTERTPKNKLNALPLIFKLVRRTSSYVYVDTYRHI